MSSLPKIKKVTVSTISAEGVQSEKVLTVIKMPLGRYGQFLERMSEVPASVSDSVKMLLGDAPGSEEPVIDTILQLPAILAKHWPDLIGLLSIASGVAEEDVADLDFDEASMLFEAVVKVNNFFGAAGRLQRMAAWFGQDTASAGKQTTQRMTPPPKKKHHG